MKIVFVTCFAELNFKKNTKINKIKTSGKLVTIEGVSKLHAYETPPPKLLVTRQQLKVSTADAEDKALAVIVISKIE